MSNQSLREAAQKLVTAWDADDELGISLALVDLTEALAQPDELKALREQLDALREVDQKKKEIAEKYGLDDKAQPVAEVYRGHYGGRNGNVGFDGVRPLRGAKLPPPGTKLYTAPQPPAEHVLYKTGDKARPERPDCFDFAMDFLGGPEDAEVIAYVEQLEAALESPAKQGAELSDYPPLPGPRHHQQGE